MTGTRLGYWQFSMGCKWRRSLYGSASPTFEAHEMLNQHHELFAQYWQWSEDWVHHGISDRCDVDSFGWECRVGITEFNERSIRNFPVQANGADILRIACILMERHGIEFVRRSMTRF